jgi:hypothetical protein
MKWCSVSSSAPYPAHVATHIPSCGDSRLFSYLVVRELLGKTGLESNHYQVLMEPYKEYNTAGKPSNKAFVNAYSVWYGEMKIVHTSDINFFY